MGLAHGHACKFPMTKSQLKSPTTRYNLHQVQTKGKTTFTCNSTQETMASGMQNCRDDIPPPSKMGEQRRHKQQATTTSKQNMQHAKKELEKNIQHAEKEL